MRLPFSKPYRAFAEFDGFSDAQCKRAIRVALAREPGLRALWSLLAVVVTVVAAIAAIMLANVALDAVGIATSNVRYDYVIGLIPAFGVGLGAVAGFLVRDLWVRRALRAFLAQVKCPDCRYSLLGLFRASDHVVCPECGRGVELAELGISWRELAEIEGRPITDPPRRAGGRDAAATLAGSLPLNRLRWSQRQLLRHPRLTRLSVSQAEVLEARIRSTNRPVFVRATVVGVLVGGAAAFVVFWVSFVVVVIGLFVARDYIDVVDFADPRVASVLIALVPALACWAWFVGAQRRSAFMSCIYRLLATHTCPGCGYSLLNLPAPGGVVHCPECEFEIAVDLTGMTLVYPAAAMGSEPPPLPGETPGSPAGPA